MLHSDIEAPNGFFEDDDDNIIVQPQTPSIRVPITNTVVTPILTKKPVTSKFSFSKFGSSRIIKPIVNKEEVTDIDSSISTVTVTEVKTDDVYIGNKVSYFYDAKAIPNLEKNKNVTAYFNQLLQLQEANRGKKVNKVDLENNQGIDDTMELFGNMKGIIREDVAENSKNRKMVEEADVSLGKLSRNQFVAKVDSSVKNYLLPSSLFDEILKLFDYMNPEERGMLIINMIFGGLMSRTKFDGFAGKAGSKEFPGLIAGIDKLKIGGANPETERVYTRTLEYIVTNGDKYRIDVGSKDQVTNMIKFIKKLSLTEHLVYFPTNLLFTDPIGSGKKGGDQKSVPLSGKPTLDNLAEFFGASKQTTQRSQAMIDNAKKSDEAKKKSDNKRGYVGQSNFMEDDFM